MVGIEDCYPEYALTARLDSLRATEYSYLDEQNHVYLDYTGSGLAAKSQHQSHNERVTSTVFGNPHSVNPTSAAATEAIEKTRARILAHLNASPDEYVVIFTANATAAARLVAESYPFTSKTKLVLTADNHNSINGIREYAKAKGTKTTYVPLTTPDLCVDEAALHAALSPAKGNFIKNQRSSLSIPLKSWFSSLFTICIGHRKQASPPSPSKSDTTSILAPRISSIHGGKPPNPQSVGETPTPPSSPSPPTKSPSPASSTTTLKPAGNLEKTILTTTSSQTQIENPIPTAASRQNGLFAYPAQSNFSGVRHPLSYIPLAQSKGYHVLLDSAAYLPTSILDLSPSSPYKPDFLILSFYKLFGSPTGVGALIARRDSLTTLLAPNRPWFSGGTISAVTVSTQWHSQIQSPASIHEAFEDGTLNFLSIPSVISGLDFLSSTITLPTLQLRIYCLTNWFLDRLSSLKHSNGQSMAIIYGPRSTAAANPQKGSGRVTSRGGTVAFNLLTPTGTIIDERIMDFFSAQDGISLRTGCFCNPGAAEAAFGLSPGRIQNLVRTATASAGDKDAGANAGVGQSSSSSSRRRRGGKLPGWRRRSSSKKRTVGMGMGMGLDEYIRLAGMQSGGAVRVSFGPASNCVDVERFLGFVERTFQDWDGTGEAEGLKPRERW